MNTIPNDETRTAAIDSLRSRYRILKTFPIGKSLLGREITALSIGPPMGATVFVGATHGLEWLTSALLLRFAEAVLDGLATGGPVSDIDLRKALRNRSLVIIPCLNPDGVEIALEGTVTAGSRAEEVARLCAGGDAAALWQANAAGVDLNHNFDAGWKLLRQMEEQAGITGPGPTRYGGPHPCSEPETAAVAGFCLTCQPRILYSFHSQGEEIYYRYGPHTPARSSLIAQILASSSGYKVCRPTGLASHGGLKDWFIEKFRRPGFTIEIGRGKNPLPLEQLDSIYRKLEEMLVIATLL